MPIVNATTFEPATTVNARQVPANTAPSFVSWAKSPTPSAARSRCCPSATSGDKRSPPMPALPTFVERDDRDVVASAWFADDAPAKTPKPVVDRLRLEFRRAVNSREVRQQLVLNGMHPVGDGPDALAKTVRADTERQGRVKRTAQFKADD